MNKLDEVKVSISVIAYNQEKYIKKCLESILMQKTNFKFEILIHDDASTDNTAKIIKEYEMKYSDIIKPIYQTENQYSKGVKISVTFNYPRAQGKYFASCEGDDFWDDEYKLQKQYDYMERNPECSMCVHAAYIVSEGGERTDLLFRPYNKNMKMTTEDVIDGWKFATNSKFYRTEYLKTFPDFYYNAPVGDYPSSIYISTKGYVYYMDELMSSYRRGADNNLTSILNKDFAKKIRLQESMIRMLREINIYYNRQYEKVIQKEIKRRNKVIINIKKEKFLHNLKKKFPILSELKRKLVKR